MTKRVLTESLLPVWADLRRGRLSRIFMYERSFHVWWRCCDFHLFSVQVGHRMWRWDLD